MEAKETAELLILQIQLMFIGTTRMQTRAELWNWADIQIDKCGMYMDVTYVQNIPEYMQTDLKQSLVGSRFFGIFPWSISISNRGFQIFKSQIDPTTLPMESEYIPISKRNATYVFFGSNEKRRALFGHLINRHWPAFSLERCLHQMAVLNVDQEPCELGDGEQLGLSPGDLRDPRFLRIVGIQISDIRENIG